MDRIFILGSELWKINKLKKIHSRFGLLVSFLSACYLSRLVKRFGSWPWLALATKAGRFLT